MSVKVMMKRKSMMIKGGLVMYLREGLKLKVGDEEDDKAKTKVRPPPGRKVLISAHFT